MNKDIQSTLNNAISIAKQNNNGELACYIPELSSVKPDLTAIALIKQSGEAYCAGDHEDNAITLQSIAKLVVLIGLLEEQGPQNVFSWVRVEPSGDDFASIARLDQFGPLPSNPMLNSGAINLCSHIPGNSEQQLAWLESWMEKLFGAKLPINQKVFASERRTGDRNRSLAYLLKSNGNFDRHVDEVLESYFYLCSFEATVLQAAYLPMLLANGGVAPDGTKVISQETSKQIISVMATCGLYNETGTHMLRTGLPAKSGVSGFIVAVAPHHGGIAVFSPRVNRKGTSIRGELMLEHVSQELGWHFAF